MGRPTYILCLEDNHTVEVTCVKGKSQYVNLGIFFGCCYSEGSIYCMISVARVHVCASRGAKES